MKVGVYIATHNNPLFLRLCLSQVAIQSRLPDMVAIHENTHPQSYMWAVDDIAESLKSKAVIILHDITHETIKHPLYHRKPLQRLFDEGCDVFFKLDHDDFFRINHIEHGLTQLSKGVDFNLNTLTAILLLPYRAGYVYMTPQPITRLNPLGGPAMTLCFNRTVAERYLAVMSDAASYGKQDDEVFRGIMQEFRGTFTPECTTVYVIHGTNDSIRDWTEDEPRRQQVV